MSAIVAPTAQKSSALLYALHGPRPPVTLSMLLGEQTRRAVLSRCDQLYGHMPRVLSGHNRSGEPAKGRRHAHFLSLDWSRRGDVDHVLVWATGGWSSLTQEALQGLGWVMLEGRRVPLRPVDFQPSFWPEVMGPSSVWTSSTPIVLTRHPKRNRQGQPKKDSQGLWRDGPQAQIERELQLRFGADLQVKEIQHLPGLDAGGRRFLWTDFRQHRVFGGGRRGLCPRLGCGCN